MTGEHAEVASGKHSEEENGDKSSQILYTDANVAETAVEGNLE